LIGLAEVVPGIVGGSDGTVMLDVDDTLKPVFGAAKQGAQHGYTRVKSLNAAGHDAAQPDHNTIWGELDRGHRGPGNGQHPVECGADAHVRLASESVAWELRRASTCVS
jgi:hypothetical protein